MRYNISQRGGAAVARVAHNHEVAGAIPAPATKLFWAGVAQWLEQSLHKAKVCGFESHPRHLENLGLAPIIFYRER